MKRRDFTKLGVFSFAASITSEASNKKYRSLAGSRPNIILVMTDDQGMGDFSCMGNPDLKTPHLDEFYKNSTRFTDFQVSPTCAPTRAAIMSGRHEFKNGVTNTTHQRERMALSTVTLPELLQSAGYETGIFGKWHLGDELPYQPDRRGFSEIFIHGAGGIGQEFEGSCADFKQNQENFYFDNVLRHNDEVVKARGFCTDVFFDAAINWTEKMRREKKPHFTYIAPNAPHAPMIAPEHYKKPFLEAGWEEFLKKDKYDNKKPSGIPGRYGMIVNIDDNMGKLVDKLNKWNAWEDTLVIFMTDNGQSGQKIGFRNGKQVTPFAAGFKTGKGSPYEGGTHVPAFWRWDGVLEPRKDISALSAHVDLLPTFCELAGVKYPKKMQKLDGRSMIPMMEESKVKMPDRFVFVHRGRWKVGADPEKSKFKGCAIRNQRWRFVDNKHLYDISRDPKEKKDVAGQYPEVIMELKKVYDQWWKETVPLMVNEKVVYKKTKPMWVLYDEQLKKGPIPEWDLKY